MSKQQDFLRGWRVFRETVFISGGVVWGIIILVGVYGACECVEDVVFL